MVSDRDNREDAALDALFAAADNARPVPSDAFLRRLEADADAAMPVTAGPAPVRGGQNDWLLGLKGFFAAAGLSGAAVLGLWIGFVMPDTLAPFTAEESVGLYTFLPGADLTAALVE